ncbi:MAG: IS5/IS1182 family transposase, partial [Planctomycetota bacterium]
KRTAKRLGREVQIVKRNDGVQGLGVLPKRGIVGRTFAWPGRCRRWSKDYESKPESSVAMIQRAMINLMVHRLYKG